jgi:hypothetical protein
MQCKWANHFQRVNRYFDLKYYIKSMIGSPPSQAFVIYFYQIMALKVDYAYSYKVWSSPLFFLFPYHLIKSKCIGEQKNAD